MIRRRSIRFGVSRVFDLKSDIVDVLEKDFAICAEHEFRDALEQTEDVHYLGDNAGETVFGRVLIETMQKKVI